MGDTWLFDSSKDKNTTIANITNDAISPLANRPEISISKVFFGSITLLSLASLARYLIVTDMETKIVKKHNRNSTSKTKYEYNYSVRRNELVIDLVKDITATISVVSAYPNIYVSGGIVSAYVGFKLYNFVKLYSLNTTARDALMKL